MAALSGFLTFIQSLDRPRRQRHHHGYEHHPIGALPIPHPWANPHQASGPPYSTVIRSTLSSPTATHRRTHCRPLPAGSDMAPEPGRPQLTQSCQSESRRGMIGYCVVSAVEVEPRIMTLALANAKSMRFSAAKCIVPSRLLRRHGAAVVTAVEVAPCTTRLESKSRRACGRAHLPMNLMICSATARGASSGI
jgi:hypothetical protein